MTIWQNTRHSLSYRMLSAWIPVEGKKVPTVTPACSAQGVSRSGGTPQRLLTQSPPTRGRIALWRDTGSVRQSGIDKIRSRNS